MEEELLRPGMSPGCSASQLRLCGLGKRKGIIRAVRLPTGKLRYPKREVEKILNRESEEK